MESRLVAANTTVSSVVPTAGSSASTPAANAPIARHASQKPGVNISATSSSTPAMSQTCQSDTAPPPPAKLKWDKWFNTSRASGEP